MEPAAEQKNAGGGKPVKVPVHRGEGTGVFQYCIWYLGCVFSRIAGWLFLGLRVEGLENIPATGPLLLLTNHQSFLDPWLLCIRLPRQVHFMARDTLFKGGFFQWLMEFMNTFPVKRGGADLQAIRTAAERLMDNRLVNIFPEGTRTADGTIGPVAPGIVLILKRVTVPLTIVPVVLDGSFEAWPRRSKFPHPHKIRIAYGRPLAADELKALAPEEVALRLRRALVELQEQLGSPHAGASRQLLEAQAAQPAGPRRGRRTDGK